ncbi:hypothetical protein OGAPHI_006251 [Ogataea philodendri]|uniref:Uncharacterized protein n=1 Tax=Ogataea philodendri TaxID=1378263 RepID=A0A9P8NYG4_9ASCO|nr:uncharacterized protein OGAPHI_006251 [Ogataea philodendri]KAH3662070.1 hypothetical protein OGAPHI_006251 [Ogataea philodendri]
MIISTSPISSPSSPIEIPLALAFRKTGKMASEIRSTIYAISSVISQSNFKISRPLMYFSVSGLSSVLTSILEINRLLTITWIDSVSEPGVAESPRTRKLVLYFFKKLTTALYAYAPLDLWASSTTRSTISLGFKVPLFRSFSTTCGVVKNTLLAFQISARLRLVLSSKIAVWSLGIPVIP